MLVVVIFIVCLVGKIVVIFLFVGVISFFIFGLIVIFFFIMLEEKILFGILFSGSILFVKGFFKVCCVEVIGFFIFVCLFFNWLFCVCLLNFKISVFINVRIKVIFVVIMVIVIFDFILFIVLMKVGIVNKLIKLLEKVFILENLIIVFLIFLEIYVVINGFFNGNVILYIVGLVILNNEVIVEEIFNVWSFVFFVCNDIVKVVLFCVKMVGRSIGINILNLYCLIFKNMIGMNF